MSSSGLATSPHTGHLLPSLSTIPVLANKKRALTVLTNERRVITVLTNERRVFTALTNERPALPGAIVTGAIAAAGHHHGVAEQLLADGAEQVFGDAHLKDVDVIQREQNFLFLRPNCIISLEYIGKNLLSNRREERQNKLN